jgi:hypothetical protein
MKVEEKKVLVFPSSMMSWTRTDTFPSMPMMMGNFGVKEGSVMEEKEVMKGLKKKLLKEGEG